MLVGHNLDFDWIPSDTGVINAAHTRRCNLIFDVRVLGLMYVALHGL